MQNESVSWDVMPEVLKLSVQEMRWCLISRTEHLSTSGKISHGTLILHQTDNPWSSYSQDLNLPDYFLRGYLKDRVCENNPQTREDIIRREIRWILQEMLNSCGQF